MFRNWKKRLFPRKIIERVFIKANRNRFVNLNKGHGVIIIYEKGKEGWLRKGRGSLHIKDNKLCSSVVTWKTNLLEVRNIVMTRNIKFCLVNFGQPVYKETKTSKFLMKVQWIFLTPSCQQEQLLHRLGRKLFLFNVFKENPDRTLWHFHTSIKFVFFFLLMHIFFRSPWFNGHWNNPVSHIDTYFFKINSNIPLPSTPIPF